MAFVGLTDGPCDYWTTFLPGITVFGIGMAVTVAPLTNVVMSSVPTQHAGMASGINNAVSRTASVLAIAIVGSVALHVFAGATEARTANIHLSKEVQIVLQSKANQLGQASILAEVAPENVKAVVMAIKLAFVDTFRVVMLVCTGLAWLSAIMGALLVENRGSVSDRR